MYRCCSYELKYKASDLVFEANDLETTSVLLKVLSGEMVWILGCLLLLCILL